MPLIRARRLERTGDWAGAASVLEAAVARDASDPELHRRLGNAYEHERRLVEAEAAYRAALRRESRPEEFRKLGRVLKRQRRGDEAALAFRMAAEELGAELAHDGANETRREQLGQALERSGDLEGARRVYQELIERDPEATDVDRRLLDAAVGRFPERRRQARFVAAVTGQLEATRAEKLGDAGAAAATSTPSPSRKARSSGPSQAASACRWYLAPARYTLISSTAPAPASCSTPSSVTA